jgi:hypothetical protein
MGTLLRYPYEVRDPQEYFDDIQDASSRVRHDGEARQNALRNAAQLRVYAFLKRALTLKSAKSMVDGRAAECRILTRSPAD